MSSVVTLSARTSALLGRMTRLGRSRLGFRIGYRTASFLSALTLAWCLGAVWRRSPSALAPSIGDDAAVGATLSVAMLLFAGVALRIARSREAVRISDRRGMVRGALTALSREAEVATGFVASLIAGTVVASWPAACELLAGWFAPVLGLSSAGCATATMLIVAAIGTVTTELARRGISRSLERA
jgi:hypothetical protein